MRTIQHWIAGSETTGASTRFGSVYDPATGDQQAQVALATAADVEAAVQAAAKAFEAWSDVSLMRRTRIMFAFRDLIERHIDELSELVADEHGKVVSDAKGEVTRGLEVVEFACGLPTLLKGEYSEQVSQIFTRSRQSMNSPVVSAVTGSGAGPPSKPRLSYRAGAPGAWPAWADSRKADGSREDRAACSQRVRQSSVSPPQA